MSRHQDLIREQFTKQVIPYSTAPAIVDEEALRLVVDFAATRPEDTVLDVASGPGHLTCAFAGRVKQATGVDITPAMVEQARELQAKKGLTNVTFQVGDVLPLPFPDGEFSIATSRYAFHHFEEPGAVFGEMKRVLEPGGKLILVDVMAADDLKKASAYNQMEKLRDPSHVRALTLAELRALFAAAGMGPPRMAFYKLEIDLENLLARSFPEPGDAETIRRMFLESLKEDGLGMGTRLEGDILKADYPIAVLAAEC